MKFLVDKTESLTGQVFIPGNKSGTARAVILGSLANGETRIKNPLLNIDSFSIINAYKALGADIDVSNPEEWIIQGTGGELNIPGQVLDLENSGTGFYMTAAVSSLVRGKSVVTGDYQICYRPAQPLIDAINKMGGSCYSTQNSGTAPLVVGGRIEGGVAEFPGYNSQWLTPFMLACSLADADSTLKVTGVLHERPYVNMTIGMLKQVGIHIKNNDYQSFDVKGNQSFKATTFNIPGDWGTSGYPMIATAITNSKVTFRNLDQDDYAGEKAFVDILRKFGARVEVLDRGKGGITVEGGYELQGAEIDCSGTPDAVPILAVLGCSAKGKTVLKNIAASRHKETDRTAIIRKELEKMGGKFEETDDSLTIYHSSLKGTVIDGHHDHRIVMATSVAGLIAEGPTLVDNAEYAAVSFPNFYEIMRTLGANIEKLKSV